MGSRLDRKVKKGSDANTEKAKGLTVLDDAALEGVAGGDGYYMNEYGVMVYYSDEDLQKLSARSHDSLLNHEQNDYSPNSFPQYRTFDLNDFT